MRDSREVNAVTLRSVTLPRVLALVGLAIGAASMPPLEVVQHLDRALYDAWIRLSVSDAPSDFVLLELDQPSEQPNVIETARWQRAALIVTTLPDAPRVAAGQVPLIGPVAIATAKMPVLRETEWFEGGFWWPRGDLDGVVRFDRPQLGDLAGTDSLPLAAARRLAAGATEALKTNSTTVRDLPLLVDRHGRRWLRFYAPASLEPVGLADIRQRADALTGKVVVIGTTSDTRHLTPVGSLTTPQLVAEAMASYRESTAIKAPVWATAAGWAGALAWIGGIGIVAPRGLVAVAAALAGASSLLALGALTLITISVWVPVAGPVLLVAGLAGLGLARPEQRSQPRNSPKERLTLLDGRRLVAERAFADAWDVYRRLPISSDLIGEIYALGCALAEHGEQHLAADAFHRVAQADAGYKDVASRLVACCATTGEDRDPERPAPSTLGRYEVLGVIGSGAMGRVYLGRDPSLNRIVAIKAIDLAKEFDASHVEEARQRFEREAEIAGRLSHPAIVTIFDVGEEHGIAYIAMEYVRGMHLSEHTTVATLLPYRDVIGLIARAADALDYAHHQNVVHRDIKPANIMYDSATNSLKITDFGVARLMDVSRTRTGVILGTPSYMSPEQLEGENVNGHTDLFALGVTLYQLLTGCLPFRGTSMTELMFVISHEPHIPVTGIRAELPRALDELLARALAKDPDARYSDGAAMARALRGVLADA